MKTQVAQTLKGSESGPIARPFAPVFGLWETFRSFLGFLATVSTVFRPHAPREQNQATDHKRSSVGNVKVGQATEKLGQLADEVGIRLDSDAEVPLAEITGSIVQSFHDLVKDFQRERQRLDDLNARLTSLKTELNEVAGRLHVPADLAHFR